MTVTSLAARPRTVAAPADVPSPPAPFLRTRRAARGRVTLTRVVNSEWIKFRSVRSTVLTLLATVGAVVALGLLFSGVHSGVIGAQTIGLQPGSGAGPVDVALGGVNLGQLIIGVLGVTLVTGEYATGMMRPTLAAVPRRLAVLWGKAIVFGGIVTVAMLVATFTAFLGGQALIGTAGASLAGSGVLRAVIGAAIYLTGVGLIGLAAGAILRRNAAAIGVLFTVVLVIPGLFPLLPQSWNDTVGPYLPSNAGTAFMTAAHVSGSLAPWAGLAVFAGYVTAALAVAAILLKRRDA
ncbi:ABC transporter permease [Rugosimonospora africana]|uniref:ABC transporter permease n=1 Tax=Rugosimonospora africana TaxID=556532 RepID=A0A8J3QTP9_9ACTN|nr:ABC transporter permease subunit [Rugosimonospora africana]GIH16653.1 ABC transporter permease [Rugosimonospora africana]